MRAPVVLAALLVAAAFAAGREEPRCAAEDATSFLGADACKKCHLKQYKSWRATRMASSFDALKPCDLESYEGKALAERKKSVGLDPEKDYRKDAKCLKCHTTGYGLPGGYPAEVTEANAAQAAKREGIQCEACHGPGSRYVPYLEKKENEQYKRSEVVKLGLTLPNRDVCITCHNEQSPFVPKEPFDFEKMKEKGTHEHVKLRFPHDG